MTMEVIFMSSKDNDDKRVMHSKNDNIGIMIGNETDETINELFESRLSRDKIFWEESMKDNEFVFDHVDGLHYKFNEISLNRGG